MVGGLIMRIDFLSVIEKSFFPALKNLQFNFKAKERNIFKLFYMDNELNIFSVYKLTGMNRVGFYLSKPETKCPVYTIRLLVLTRGNKMERKIFENARDYFVFDTKDELIGILDFVYGILKQYVYSFFCENLDKEIDNCFEILDKKKKEKYKNVTKEQLHKIGHEMGGGWNKIRFLDRKNL
jgi:hypothetical protein